MAGRIVGYLRRNAIALVALTVALGGTAYAARDGVGARDLATIKVRVVDQDVGPKGQIGITSKCKRREQYLSGGYDLGFANKVELPKFNVTSAGPFLGGGRTTKAVGFQLNGQNEEVDRTIAAVAALCLKR